MPVHDWSRAEPGIFHDFRHGWISTIGRLLNDRVLPTDYYALAERFAVRQGIDSLTGLDSRERPERDAGRDPVGTGGTVRLAPPRLQPIAQSDAECYRRKQSSVGIRSAGDDRLVAVVEVVSPGNKSTRRALEQLMKMAAEFLERSVHLLIVDLFPPGRHDPAGIHGAIWDYIDGRPYSSPPDRPLTVAAYESAAMTRTYVERLAVGDPLPEMPLFLEPGGCVEVPLEDSYRSAWEAVPRRWRTVLEPPQ